MSSTTNNKMDSPSASDPQPSSIGSPASTTPEEVESSPEPEGSEPTQAMAVIPHAPLETISNGTDLHFEDSSLLTTSGHVYSVDIPSWYLSSNPIYQQHTTGTFPSLISTTMGFPFAEQAVLANSQPTHTPATMLAGFHWTTPAGFSHGLGPMMPLSTANTIPPPPAPGTMLTGYYWTTPAGGYYGLGPMMPLSTTQDVSTTNTMSMASYAHHPHLPNPNILHLTSLGEFPDFAEDRRERARPSFDAVAFVDTLEEVDIATIDPDDMTCPHCYLPFGTTTVEDDPFILAYMNEMDRKITWRLEASFAMPFCENKPNNDPVKTPCGHVFGKQCLIQSLEEVNKRCPKCRQGLGGTASVPTGSVAPSDYDDNDDDGIVEI